MPTNANTFNSRVTSESLEAKFRQVFPAQGGAELVQDLFASGVIQPVVDFSSVAEGSVLAPNLQTAWDFSTGSAQVETTDTTLITNTGFWLVDVSCTIADVDRTTVSVAARLWIDDGSTEKNVWGVSRAVNTENNGAVVTENKFVVFLRSSDSLQATTENNSTVLDVWYRQIADVNGTLVNPLGFTFN